MFSYLGFEKKKKAVSGDLGVEKKPKGEFYALVKSSENCVPVLVTIPPLLKNGATPSILFNFPWLKEKKNQFCFPT